MCMNDKFIGNRNFKNRKVPERNSKNSDDQEISKGDPGMSFQHLHINRKKTAELKNKMKDYKEDNFIFFIYLPT